MPFDTFDTFAFDFDTFAFDTVSFDFDTVSFAFDTVSFDFGTFFSDPFSFDSFAGALALGVDRPEDSDLVVACDLDPGEVRLLASDEAAAEPDARDRAGPDAIEPCEDTSNTVGVVSPFAIASTTCRVPIKTGTVALMPCSLKYASYACPSSSSCREASLAKPPNFPSSALFQKHAAIDSNNGPVTMLSWNRRAASSANMSGGMLFRASDMSGTISDKSKIDLPSQNDAAVTASELATRADNILRKRLRRTNGRTYREVAPPKTTWPCSAMNASAWASLAATPATELGGSNVAAAIVAAVTNSLRRGHCFGCVWSACRCCIAPKCTTSSFSSPVGSPTIPSNCTTRRKPYNSLVQRKEVFWNRFNGLEVFWNMLEITCLGQLSSYRRQSRALQN